MLLSFRTNTCLRRLQPYSLESQAHLCPLVAQHRVACCRLVISCSNQGKRPRRLAFFLVRAATDTALPALSSVSCSAPYQKQLNRQAHDDFLQLDLCRTFFPELPSRAIDAGSRHASNRTVKKYNLYPGFPDNEYGEPRSDCTTGIEHNASAGPCKVS